MRIIKNNFNPPKPEWPKEWTCAECNSELEYYREDLIQFWRTEGWTNSSIKYEGIQCPCCNYQNGIKDIYVSQ